MKTSNKLKGKDLINIGIYAAIYCVVMMCIAMLGALLGKALLKKHFVKAGIA